MFGNVSKLAAAPRLSSETLSFSLSAWVTIGIYSKKLKELRKRGMVMRGQGPLDPSNSSLASLSTSAHK